MLDVIFKKATAKASFVGDISFGPRGQYQSLPNINPANAVSSFHIQNLYATYQFSDRFSISGGYMGTFVGYEAISPTANFNYSTSYLFTNGPFQNAGIKANLAISGKVGLMIGVFNDWNLYQDFNGVSHLGMQLSLTPIKGWTACLNLLSGRGAGGAATYGSGTILDITTSYQFSEKLKIVVNAADYSQPHGNGGYSGIAVYPQVLFDAVALGARAEYFRYKDVGITSGSSIVGVTFSGNVKAGPLTLIPEFRFDNDDAAPFFKRDLSSTTTASQFLVAAVYAF